MNKAKVAGGRAIKLRGYSAKPFDPCEEVFNDMSFQANALDLDNFPLSIFSPWNHGKPTVAGNFITQGIAVVSFVHHDSLFCTLLGSSRAVVTTASCLGNNITLRGFPVVACWRSLILRGFVKLSTRLKKSKGRTSRSRAGKSWLDKFRKHQNNPCVRP